MAHNESPSLSHMLTQLGNSEDGRVQLSEDWSQGRSAFGGLSAALAVTAMRRQLGEAKPMRSLMVSFIAPIPPGEVRASARIQREGRSVSQLGADLYCGDQLCLQAMGVFGHGRPARSVTADSARNMGDVSQGVPFDQHAKRLPSFLHYFEGSWLDGVMPFVGKPARQMRFWVRHREPLDDFPIERLVTLADIPPPVILSHYDKPPVPASSLSWSLEFVQDPATIELDWSYMEFDLDAAADGYTQQSGRLYNEKGELLLLTRQCMVYFEPKPES